MKNIYWHIIVCIIIAAGCKKTENFYDQLDDLPRANKLTNNAYAVGDTLSLTGKFGKGNATLTITVGGVPAPVLSLTTDDSSYVKDEVLYNYTVDIVKVLITEPMIGQQQPVVVTVNGISSTVASILVAKDRPLPARTDTLSCLDPAQYKVALQMPLGTRVVPNYTPGGAIVFINGDSIISWQEGVTRRGKVTWSDHYGDFTLRDFSNTRNYGLATDPAGQYLYISCLTRDNLLPGTTHSALRLMKISLQDYTITTLNRTVLPTNANYVDAPYVDLDTAKREGPIQEVFFPVWKNIYVNSRGELYLSAPSFNWNAPGTTVSNLGTANLAIGRIDASGNFQYLVKGNTGVNKIFQVRFRKNGVINSTYDFLPDLSTTFSYNRLMSIDPEHDLLYAYGGSGSTSLYNINTFYCYSLSQYRQLSDFTYKQVSGAGSLTITDGPFDVVEGEYVELTSGLPIWIWPAPGQSMTIFATLSKTQEMGRYEYQWQGENKFVYCEKRSIKVIHFDTRTVSTYATILFASSNGMSNPINPANPGETFYAKYSTLMGGDVIGYTASQLPVMLRNKERDPQLTELLLMEPIL